MEIRVQLYQGLRVQTAYIIIFFPLSFQMPCLEQDEHSGMIDLHSILESLILLKPSPSLFKIDYITYHIRELSHKLLY